MNSSCLINGKIVSADQRPPDTPVVVDGTLLSWADYMGFVYVRTGTPEYIRIIEVGSLRMFGGHSTMISAYPTFHRSVADALARL